LPSASVIGQAGQEYLYILKTLNIFS